MLREIPSFSDHIKSTEVRIAYEGHRPANAPYRADGDLALISLGHDYIDIYYVFCKVSRRG